MRFIATIVAAVLFSVQTRAASLSQIKTVFIIVMENTNWSAIKGNPSAPYINNTLIPLASRCEQYKNPPGIHPSEPNYLWLEAGTNFGISDDLLPSVHHQNTTNHFTTQLKNANVAWRTYQEGITGTYIPLTNITATHYYPKHNPFIFFDDVTGTNNSANAYGIAHVRPYSELAADLVNNTVARYNFITPDQCHDMHDSCAPVSDNVKQGDLWLSTNVPAILASAAYTNGGALFITWDEGEGSANPDGPIGMLVLSPLARGGGYYNNIKYTHSSTLRTFQNIFGVSPFLGDAANATDLSDLFSYYGFTSGLKVSNGWQFNISGVIPGKTNILLATTNLASWTPINTNISATNNYIYTDTNVGNYPKRFYRLLQVP